MEGIFGFILIVFALICRKLSKLPRWHIFGPGDYN